jgi:L-alanine-DL-glutamate epimerase-like enolase superfamily enzyme
VHDRADAHALARVLRRIGAHLVGRSPSSVNAFCRDVFQAEFKAWGANNPRFANQLLAGFEMALWDLIGKQTGRPVYDLFGGEQRPSVGYFYFLQGGRSTSSWRMPSTPRPSGPPSST